MAGGILVLGSLGGAAAKPVRAAAPPPRVAIDIGPAVECRDVTPADFTAAHADEKIVEATFRLSVLLLSGREEQLDELRLAIDSPERRLRVVDFQPRSELASELAGDVEVSATDEKTQSLNASLGGVVSGGQGPVRAQAAPAAGVGVTQNRGSKETFHRLSPKQLVVAAGTTGGEHGVLFKWRRTTQAAVEGSREVTCRFRVPKTWRGDWVLVSCDVTGRHRNYLGEKIEPCGQARLYVALHLAGDADAQQAARELADAQMPASSSANSLREPAGSRRVAYKAPPQATERVAKSDWFAMPPLFKPCSHMNPAKREAAEPAEPAFAAENELRAPDVPTALEAVRQLAGQ
ncbi:MAG: hypothetical protein HYX69_19405 [Planctomycetia bacterium]|nr:hypothetical protein [Planctomycetia bacterium]